MTDTASTFVVVAAYNEGTVLRTTLAPVIEQGYSVVVVDDGSRDETWAVLQDLPVHAVQHPINLGQGAALQTGMTYALRHGAEFIVHFDADGQHPAEQIEALLAPVRAGRADVAMGCRFLRKADRAEVPALKTLVLKAGCIVSGLMTGVWLRDTHNGFRAMSAAAAGAIDLKVNGFAHATEILEQIRRARLRYEEVPVTIRYTDYSRSKGQSVTNAFTILVDLLFGKLFPMTPIATLAQTVSDVLPDAGRDPRVAQIILIVLLVVGLVIYFARLRSSLLDRVIAMTVFVLGLFFVIFPDATNSVANMVGVGRGADLLLYLTTFGLGFVALLLFSKTRQLESQITRLARAVAINDARPGGPGGPGGPVIPGS